MGNTPIEHAARPDDEPPLRVDTPSPGLCVLTLDRPRRRNAMVPALREALGAALAAAIEDDAVRAVVITGAGGHFCAGGDLDRLAATEPAALDAMLRSAHQVIRAIAAGPKPVVAAVEGDAAGGGAGLALACDFVVASESARIGLPFLSIGLVPDWGLAHSIARRAGTGVARRLLLDPRPILVEEASRLGLVDEVVPTGDALARSVALASRLGALAPNAWSCTKRLLAQPFASLDDALERELEAQRRCFGSDEFRAGVAAFLARANRAAAPGVSPPLPSASPPGAPPPSPSRGG